MSTDSDSTPDIPSTAAREAGLPLQSDADAKTHGFRLSISTKLIVVVALLLGAVIGLFGLLQDMTQREVFQQVTERERRLGEAAVRNAGIALARRIATSVAPAIAEHNYPYASEVIAKTVEEEDQVLRITVTDAEGAIVGDTDASHSARVLDPVSTRTPGELEYRRKVELPKEQAMIFVAPAKVGATIVGDSRVVYSMAALQRQLAEISAKQRAARERVLHSTLVIAAICMLVSSLLAAGLALSITRPIKKLAGTARKLASGNLDARARLRSSDEVGQLGDVFNQMADSVKKLLVDVAAGARLEKELEVVRTIQEGFVPPNRPITVGRLQLAGFYEPASVCGGDWWNYISVDDQRQLLVIGDVTGHGVPSAMLTATAKGACDATYAMARQDLSVGLLMRNLNTAICAAGGRLKMTCFAALFDWAAGTLTFANAAHPPPLFRCQGHGVNLLQSPPCLQLGEEAEAEYPERTVDLQSVELLVCFTDGLTECENSKGRAYGYSRLYRLLREHEDQSVEQLRARISHSASAYRGATPQEDDITFVVAMPAV